MTIMCKCCEKNPAIFVGDFPGREDFPKICTVCLGKVISALGVEVPNEN